MFPGILCPRCSASIDVHSTDISCSNCGQSYPRLGGIPVLLRNPDAYLVSCRRQLGLLEQQSARTVRAIEDQLSARDILPTTRTRCQAMIDAVHAQTADIQAVLKLPPLETADSKGPPAPLQYIQYLYRDWGWPADPEGEPERALSSMREVIEGKPLGQTLVIGAGACRLAYDLHRLHPENRTTVLDIDPFLLSTAQKIIRGGSVTMREANAEIDELGSVSKEWTLTAPHGPIAEDRFQFLLADGLAPPFATQTFDTVVTPWFIDLVPPDLRNFISTLHRLVKPGGHWLNLGPLRYRPEVPVARRFAREEVFELAGLAGFRVERWDSGSVPYLVSKLNGRGKVEWVLTFAATRVQPPDRGSPPAWLLFTHIPVPVFPGLSLFHSEDPAEQMVASAIDGRNTVDDIAGTIASNAGDSGLTMDQLREIVRRCLVDIHPGS